MSVNEITKLHSPPLPPKKNLYMQQTYNETSCKAIQIRTPGKETNTILNLLFVFN